MLVTIPYPLRTQSTQFGPSCATGCLVGNVGNREIITSVGYAWTRVIFVGIMNVKCILISPKGSA